MVTDRRLIIGVFQRQGGSQRGITARKSTAGDDGRQLAVKTAAVW